MSKKNKNIITNREDFLKYTANKMSPEERNAFERKLQSNAFEEEAAEGFALISQEQAKKDILQLSTSIRNRIQTNRNIVWYRIAASVAALAIVSSVFFLVIKNRIDKGAGQMIITQSNSTQNEEAKIAAPQNQGPVQPEVEKKSIAEGIGRKSTTRDRLKEAKPAKRTETPGPVIVTPEKAKTKTESSELVSGIPSAPSIQPEAISKISLQEKADDNLQGKGLMALSTGTRTIHGIILSMEDNTPLPGVSVSIKGSSQGTTSDIHGRFSIPVEMNSKNIILAQSGMNLKEISLKDSAFLSIKIEPGILALEDVTVVGYGAQKKTSITLS
jgi:hypothetical protein